MSEKHFLEQVNRHQAIIHKICRLYRDSFEDREDLFQEIMFQLWQSFPSFEGKSKITSWMYRIALNTALASFRKHNPDIAFTDNLPEYAEAASNEEQELQKEKLLAALKKLDDTEKAIIALYFEDMSYGEIAAITGISENYVGVKLNRIKTKIQKLLNI